MSKSDLILILISGSLLILSIACGQELHEDINKNYSISSIDVTNLSLNGMKFEDLDMDGFRDGDEPGIPGWTIRILRNFSEIQNTTTDQSGHYIFDNLLPGDYTVMEDQMMGWNQSAPGGREYSITLTDTPAYNLDFGNFRANASVKAPTSVGRTYPLMQVSPEMLQRWKEEYDKAPSAFISPQLTSQISEEGGASLSLLSYLQYTPAERDQGYYCGSCWVWTGTGIMEIDLAAKQSIKDRLSEQYLITNYNGDADTNWGCCPGNLLDVETFYTDVKKEVPWSNSNAQYQDGNSDCSGSTIAYSTSTNPNYPLSSITRTKIPTWLSEGISQETAIANIKNILAQHKAVGLLFHLPTEGNWSTFQTRWGTEAESNVINLDFAQGITSTTNTAHWVLCVGYDDTDPNNSYWIMVNSWGTGWTNNRPNCIFRVNMNMNYGSINPGWGESFWWETLDISYPPKPMGEKAGIGLFRPSTARWYLDYDNNGASNYQVTWGASTDKPVAGDWDGDGTDEIGLFRPSTRMWYLDYDNNGASDYRVTWGDSTDIPVAGDWDGDNKDEIGLFRPSTRMWYLDYDNNGASDYRVTWGDSTDIPVAEDWDGDDKDEIGLFRPSTRMWYLDYDDNGASDYRVTWGDSTDKPVVGRWTGCMPGVCGSYTQCDSSCGSLGGYCFKTTEGTGKCLADWSCSSSHTSCTSSSQCGSGVCVTGSCCGYNECRPASDFCSVNEVPMSAEQPTGLTASGAQVSPKESLN
ncbi:MAG: SdrD B-like domain-containing protein [Methanothrix sp.]